MTNKKRQVKIFIIGFLVLLPTYVLAQEAPKTFKNPIVSGFHSDPSICRVGDIYYMTHPTLEYFPALPVMRSKDLVNWEKIGHAIHRPEQLNLPDGLDNSLGMFAPSIRHYNDTFYIICTCVGCNGNFIVTSTHPEGPWSNPIWINGSIGIDPTLFWDEDGTCYFLAAGQVSGNKDEWPGKNGIYLQEINPTTGVLTGEPIQLTHGHAANARWTEGPRLFKINGEYLLMAAEGGTNEYHAVTVFNSKYVKGPYIPNHANPVITHRQLSYTYPIVKAGHADLVQTQNGDWWSVLHAKRPIDGYSVLCRETFLAKVEMTQQESGVTPIYNPGIGLLQLEQERPNLPWTPVPERPERDEFDSEILNVEWICLRSPTTKWYKLNNGTLELELRPEVIDDLVSPSFLAQRIRQHHFKVTTKIRFDAKQENERAGIVLYRKSSTHYQLLKEKGNVTLIKTVAESKTGTASKKEIITSIPYFQQEIYLEVIGHGLDLQFFAGESLEEMKPVGGVQDLSIVSDEIAGRFNGTVIGLYATSSGRESKGKAIFEWFLMKEIER